MSKNHVVQVSASIVDDILIASLTRAGIAFNIVADGVAPAPKSNGKVKRARKAKAKTAAAPSKPVSRVIQASDGDDPALVNTAGVLCGNAMNAWLSSVAITRHLIGTCSCETEPSKCKANARYDGFDASNFGSDADAAIPVAVQESHDAYIAARDA